MKASYRHGFSFSALIIALVFLLGTATAQVPNDIDVQATDEGGSIKIAVYMDIGGELPAEWVGWVLVRSTLGNCDQSSMQISGPTPFVPGAGTLNIWDHAVVPGVTYQYLVLAVDAQGIRHSLQGFILFPPAYYHFDFASVSGDGVVAEGRLIDLVYTVGLEVCDDSCWGYIAFISNASPELASLVGLPLTVRITGRLDADFEGPYITEVSDWSVVPGCFTVPSETSNWGNVKTLYR